MHAIFELLIVLAAMWLVWRFIARLLRPRAPAEPAEEPFSEVPASRARGPKGRSGAVAIAEPDDDEISDAYPPRSLE